MRHTGGWIERAFGDLSVVELYELLRLRSEVFVVEQRCPYLDPDGLDIVATHLLLFREGRLIACQRMLPPGASWRESSLGRIAVRRAARGARLGSELVQLGIAYNLETWPGHDIRIGAQARLRSFYERLGFRVDGAGWTEDGIAHLPMRFSAH